MTCTSISCDICKEKLMYLSWTLLRGLGESVCGLKINLGKLLLILVKGA